jgi:hypothetical protein
VSESNEEPLPSEEGDDDGNAETDPPPTSEGDPTATGGRALYTHFSGLTNIRSRRARSRSTGAGTRIGPAGEGARGVGLTRTAGRVSKTSRKKGGHKPTRNFRSVRWLSRPTWYALRTPSTEA